MLRVNRSGWMVGFLLLVLVMSSSALAESVTLRWATGLQGEYLEVLKKRIEIFEEQNPHIDVIVEAHPGGFRAVAEQLLLLAGTGNMPDVVHVVLPDVPGLIDAGLLLDVTELAAKSSIDESRYVPLRDNLTKDGRLYGGFDTHFQMNPLFYNRSLFDAAGFEDPNALHARGEWTWDRMADFAAKLTVIDGVSGATQRYGMGMHTYFTSDGIETWLASGGAGFVDDRFETITIADVNAVETIEFMVDMWTARGSASPYHIGAAHLVNGDVAMLLGGTWLMNWFVEYAPDFDWDIAPFPMRHAGSDPVYLRDAGTSGLVTSGTAHPDEAWKLVEFMLGPDWQMDAARSRLELPVSLDALTSEYFLRQPPQHIAALVDMANHSVNVKYFSGSDQIRGILQEQLLPAYSGVIGVRAAVDNAARLAQALLDESRSR